MQTKRFVLIWLAFTAIASAQNFYPKKDAAFGQVVVGGGFETVINLTNRGTQSHAGTLFLFRTVNEATVPWNPMVNGVAVANGEYAMEIQPQSTVTLRLTGSQLESGAAILRSDYLRVDNLIEANLTYLVRKDGQVSDSVGIAPSKEFYRATIPFEEFSETALALVNGDLSGDRTAEVELALFSEDNQSLGTAPITLGAPSHLARFLYELFPGQTLRAGRVEIASDFPILGTALTLKGGEFSSIPLDPAPVTYAVRLLSSFGSVATGEIALWAEGSFIRGYMVISAVDSVTFDDPEFSLVNGELQDGRLRLAFTIFHDPFLVRESTMSLGHDQFSFESNLVPGAWIEHFQDKTFIEGTYELRRHDGG